MFHNITQKLLQSPRRVRDFCSNLFAGMITGGIIGGFMTIIQKSTGVTYQWPSFLQILIFVAMFVFLYLYIKKMLLRIKGSEEEIKNYKSNIKAGLYASIFVTFILIFQSVWIRLIVIIPLVIILAVILYFTAGKKETLKK